MNSLGDAYLKDTGYRRNRLPGGGLDWLNRPSTFREYPGEPIIQISENSRTPEHSAGDVMLGRVPERTGVTPNLELLGSVLDLAAGITAEIRQGEGAFYFRAYPSAGALYPLEVYCVTHGVRGIEDGLYHYTLARQALTPLRKGDLSSFLREEVLKSAQSRVPRITFLVSSVFFRSAWKYKARAYRYCLLDGGHLMENLLLAMHAHGISADWWGDFEDTAADALIGAAPDGEATMAVIGALSAQTNGDAGASPDPIPAIQAEPSPLAPEVETYARIQAVHQETAKALAVTHRDDEPPARVPGSEGLDFPWAGGNSKQISFRDVVRSRRSKRNYVDTSPGEGVLGELLSLAFSADGNRLFQAPGPEVDLVLGGGTELEAGIYRLYPHAGRMMRMRQGDFRDALSRVCLNQTWIRKASMVFAFHADLTDLEDRYGPRVFRYVMIKSGRMAQRIYLAASALNLGACGIGAFYDEEGEQLLGLSRPSALLYLVSVGPVKE